MPEPSRSRIARELLAAQFGAFRGVESWVMDRLASALEPDDVRAHEIIYRAGDPAEFLYFVREGRIETRAPPHTRVVTGPSVFGVFDVLLERARTAPAVALTDVGLMKVRGETWLELLDDSFELGRVALLAMARSLAELEQQIAVSGDAEAAPPERRRAGALDALERVETLLSEPLLRGVGVQAISDLAMMAEEHEFDAGQVIFERGVARERMFVVVEGTVMATRADPVCTRRATAGQLVCGAAAFAQPSLGWEARAESRVRLLSFRIEDWFDLLEEHSDLLRATLAAFASQLDKALDGAIPVRPIPSRSAPTHPKK